MLGSRRQLVTIRHLLEPDPACRVLRLQLDQQLLRHVLRESRQAASRSGLTGLCEARRIASIALLRLSRCSFTASPPWDFHVKWQGDPG